jgi:hypothetical protein
VKQELIDRIIREGAVDTDKYRYLCETDNKGARIKRLPLDILDTTAARDGWEIVKVLEGE